MEVKDSNGNILQEGDSVQLIQDLKLGGSSVNVKRGTVAKKIRFTEDPELIQGRTDDYGVIFLKTGFVKKR